MPVKSYEQFAAYYEAHMPSIFRYIYARVSDRALAEDLVSEISLKGLEHFESYDETKPFIGWFYGIARNHLIDYFKRMHRYNHVSLDEIEGVLPDDSSPRDDAVNNIERERLHAALGKLPEAKREIVTLHYLSGYSYREIGDMLGKDENTVKVATFRALQDLKQHLTN